MDNNCNNYNYNNHNDMTDTIFSNNIHLVASNKTMPFNFHYIRAESERLNDSVIKINIWDNDTLKEFIVNNIQIKTTITGVRIFDSDDNNKLIRFVLSGEAVSLYIYDTFAIME